MGALCLQTILGAEMYSTTQLRGFLLLTIHQYLTKTTKAKLRYPHVLSCLSVQSWFPASPCSFRTITLGMSLTQAVYTLLFFFWKQAFTCSVITYRPHWGRVGKKKIDVITFRWNGSNYRSGEPTSVPFSAGDMAAVAAAAGLLRAIPPSSSPVSGREAQAKQSKALAQSHLPLSTLITLNNTPSRHCANA